MKQSRRNFLRMIGVGAGAAIAAPVFALVPEPQVDLAVLEAEYHQKVLDDLLTRIREGVYEQVQNSNYETALEAARGDAFANMLFQSRVVTPDEVGLFV